jgi:hypothetical protein
MSTVDKQRIAAVRELEQLGYPCAAGGWMHLSNGMSPASAITDALHALLVKRSDDLEGCTEGSDEEHELAAITDAIEAYQAVRWPLGRTQGGEGLAMHASRRLGREITYDELALGPSSPLGCVLSHMGCLYPRHCRVQP